MSLDPKKLEAAVYRYINVTDLLDDQALHIVTELLEAYGVPELEARAARADDLAAYNYELQSLLHDHGKIIKARDAEIAALKAELARFEWRDISHAPKENGHVIACEIRSEEGFPDCMEVLCTPFFMHKRDGKEELAAFNQNSGNINWIANYTHFLPAPPQAKEADHES